jgi:hypothetical protein
MKETGLTIKLKVRESISTLMEQPTKDNGVMMFKAEKEQRSGLMGQCTKAFTAKEKNRGKDSLNGKTALNTKAISLIITSME